MVLDVRLALRSLDYLSYATDKQSFNVLEPNLPICY